MIESVATVDNVLLLCVLFFFLGVLLGMVIEGKSR